MVHGKKSVSRKVHGNKSIHKDREIGEVMITQNQVQCPSNKKTVAFVARHKVRDGRWVEVGFEKQGGIPVPRI